MKTSSILRAAEAKRRAAAWVDAYHRGEDRPAADLDSALGISTQHDDANEDRAYHQHVGETVADVPTPYAVCRGLFGALALQPSDVFVDLGCGVGRVVLYGALLTAARFRGVELVAERAAALGRASRRLGLDRLTVHHGNVLDEDFGVGTVFYAFRPFSEDTEKAVMRKLHDEARRRPLCVVTHRMQPNVIDEALFTCDGGGQLRVWRTH